MKKDGRGLVDGSATLALLIYLIGDHYVLWVLIRNHNMPSHLFLLIDLKQKKLYQHSVFDLFQLLP